MFQALSLAVVIASAMVALGETADSAKRSAKTRHRTPFIVPISPPVYGLTPSLPVKSEGATGAAVRLPSQRLHTRTAAPLPIGTRAPMLTTNHARLLPKVDDALNQIQSQWLTRSMPASAIVKRQTPASMPRIESTGPHLADHEPAEHLVTNQQPAARLTNGQSPDQLPADTPKQANPTVHVAIDRPNLTALIERITVHNLTLAALEDKLIEDDFWTLEEIEAAVEKLTSLADSQQVWGMYYQLLKKEDKRRIGAAMTTSRSIDLVLQRLFESKVALQIQPYAVTNIDREQADARFDELSTALQELQQSKSDQ